MVAKRVVPNTLVVLVAFLILGGTVVGLVVPALRGEIRGPSAGGVMGSTVSGTTVLVADANQGSVEFARVAFVHA